MQGLQYSIHRPSLFMRQHQADLLPDWSVPIAALLILLQPCPVSLRHKNPAAEYHKQQLRDRFFKLSQPLVAALLAEGAATTIFDPITGQPDQSRPGQLKLDDAAVVRAVLGYPLISQGSCHLVEHPIWGCNVFPSVLVSAASTETLCQVAHDCWGQSIEIEAYPAMTEA